MLRSGKDRVFCAGANIRMLASATHAHKVNFCKFTNETRNGIEDASEHSDQKYLCVVNGTAAGGGYELALACDHIMLVDDGSAAVSLPELPLLAVLPGTGGLTRVTDKRKVRRDHADVFCTTEEGVKGKRAVDWRLVDEVDAALQARRGGGEARRGDRRGGRATAKCRGQGHRAHRRSSASAPPTRTNTSTCRWSSRARTASPPSRCAAPTALRRPTPTRWSRKAPRSGCCRSRASSTTRSSTSGSTSWRSPPSCSSRSAIRSACSSTTCSSSTQNDHWLAREITLKWKRVLKRVDMTSRSIVTLIEPGSCFAGTLAELVFAADRSYMLIGQLRGRQPPARRDHPRRCELLRPRSR